ncbi:MAG: thioredoxin family protein [Aliihoeflea sp.]
MINRRTILAAASVFALLSGSALAAEKNFYTPGSAERQMDAGELVLLDFWASWCTTCAAQVRVLDRLRAENPEYDRAISFITVDWDQHAQGDLARQLAIPRRSTLVAMKGRTEIGRIVAGTREADIKALLDAALAAR